MVHITLDGYTGAAERRPRRDARPLHTGTTLVPFLSLALLSLSLFPSSTSFTDVAPTPSSISFSHLVFRRSVFPICRRHLSFALSIAFYSPSRSPPTPLSTLFTIVESLFLSLSPFSFNVDLTPPRICRRRTSDYSHLCVCFFSSFGTFS